MKVLSIDIGGSRMWEEKYNQNKTTKKNTNDFKK